MSSASTLEHVDDVDSSPLRRGEGSKAVLLLHGLTGTPYEVRPLAEALAAHGYAVYAPLLAGHASLEELEHSTWRDWYDSAHAALASLREQGAEHVVVVGFSMGALLALRLAALCPTHVQGLVAMSVPLAFSSSTRVGIFALSRLRQSPLLGSWVGALPRLGEVAVRIVRARAGHPRLPSLQGFPFPALAQLLALQDEVQLLLTHVRIPLLIAHGRFDLTCHPRQSHRLARQARSDRVELVILPRSHHLVALGPDAAQLAEEVVRFTTSVFDA